MIDLKNKSILCPPISIILLSFSSGKFGIINFFKGIKATPRAKVVTNNDGIKAERNGANKAATVTDLKSKNKFCPIPPIFLLSFSSGKFLIINFFISVKTPPRANVTDNNTGVKTKRGGANNATCIIDLKNKRTSCPASFNFPTKSIFFFGPFFSSSFLLLEDKEAPIVIPFKISNNFSKS